MGKILTAFCIFTHTIFQPLQTQKIPLCALQLEVSLPLSSDLALERAMFSCVLRPLRSHLDKALVELHNKDGSIQRLTQNLLQLKGDAAMERLGVRTGVPDSREVERVKQKIVLMQRTHSPIDKVLLLLQVCKCVHKAMGSLHGELSEYIISSAPEPSDRLK